MSEKLIYVLSSFHMLFIEFYIHIHIKLIIFPLNLVLQDFWSKASDLVRKYVNISKKRVNRMSHGASLGR